MKVIARLRAAGEKRHVEFDDEGHVLGKNGAMFRSYLGLLARSKVPITIKVWKEVPDEIKNRIWDDLSAVFTGIEHRRSQELVTAGKMWRGFKTTLTNKYITKKTAKGESPLQEYTYLNEQMWNEFVQQRQTPEFKAVSEEQKARVARNKYPHAMSRGGYAIVDDEMRKEKIEQLKLSGEPYELSDIEIPRHERWKRGRISKKTGKFITPDVEEVAARIDDLSRKAGEGSFQSSGQRDILTKAIGTDEHPGRARGIGGDVGLKKAFPHKKKRSMVSDDVLQARVDEAVFNALQALGVDASTLQKTLMSKASTEVEMKGASDSHRPSTKASQAFDPFKDIPEEGVECALKIREGKKCRLVARGKVYKDSTLHCGPLPAEHMKVLVEVPVIRKAPVPVPTDEVETVEGALGGFIAWPKTLIDLNLEVIEDASEESDDPKQTSASRSCEGHDSKSPKVVEKDKLVEKELKSQTRSKMTEGTSTSSVATTCLPKSCRRLYTYTKLMNSETLITIPMDSSLMGIQYNLTLSKEDILELLRMTSLNTAVVELYIRWLVGLCDQLHVAPMYGFASPSMMSAGNPISTRLSYLSLRMRKNAKDCYLVPYIDPSPQVQHWMLCAVYPKDNCVYWLDSLQKGVRPDFRETVEEAMKDYRVRGGGKSARFRNKTKWIKVKCPEQSGGTECGYYVMAYMKDIILGLMDEYVTTIEQCFQYKAYSQAEIDAVRDQWASYLLDTLDELDS